MSPAFTMNNSPNTLRGDVVFFCKRRECLAFIRRFANGNNFGLFQFYISGLFTNQDSSSVIRTSFSFGLSVLGKFIVYILTSCAKKQMFWINAAWVIARMANQPPRFNHPLMDSPRNPMRSQEGGAVIGFYRSVSVFVSASSPLPTASRFLDFSVKSTNEFFRNWYMSCLHGNTLYQSLTSVNH